MTSRVNIFQSMSAQLFTGATLLLVLTVALISYFLTVHQETTLTTEMEKAVALQGRNIALTSAKPLLRSDPEFELYPLVTKMLEDVPQIESIVIVDGSGRIQGHGDLVMISKLFDLDARAFTTVLLPLLADDEQLMQNDDASLFITPVASAGKRLGSVYLTYSKRDLIAGKRETLTLTIRIGLGALALGLFLSLIFSRNISRGMEAMLEGVDAIGRGQLNARIELKSRNEFRILAHAFNGMSRRIQSAQSELVAKERMDRELEIAADIQQSLISAATAAPEGYEIARHYQSAYEVGGDYVDVIPTRDGRIGLVMADVSGKGVPGLVVMAMVKVLAKQLIASGPSPSDVLRSINASLLGNIKRNMFVTIFVAMLDSDKNRIIFANAGHNPLLIYENETARARTLKMEGLPLGAFPSEDFDGTVRDYHLDLQGGDVLLQYTDGLTESRNEDGAMFGIDRVLESVSANGKHGAGTLVENLVAGESRFRGDAAQFDDITLLAIGRTTTVSSNLEEPVI
ncbi:MAG: SpoIIE family protein phosphatase [Candidatus Krumholzibacteriota bacterium]|nr:SpoIIE family protein phosphatase [Candidatus Krumholzibacteriota bacterium]